MSNELRTTILQALADRINAKWGPSGTVSRTFRLVRCGRWMPAQGSNPAATVTDDGQRMAELYRGRSGGAADLQAILNVAVVLELPAQWDRNEGTATWTDFVQNLIGDLTCWTANELGLIECRYADDAPWQAVLQSGQTVDVWIVHFEVEYVMAAIAAT